MKITFNFEKSKQYNEVYPDARSAVDYKRRLKKHTQSDTLEMKVRLLFQAYLQPFPPHQDSNTASF